VEGGLSGRERTFTGYFAFRGRGRYDPGVFGLAGRRVAEALVALFALLGFVFVPLGEKSAFQHAVAIFSTPAAVVAFGELAGAVERLKDRVLDTVVKVRAAPEREPRPEVPKLGERPAKKH